MTPAEQIVEFCARIRPTRKRLSMSTTELAKYVTKEGAPVHQSTINRIERGLQAPDWATAIGISVVLEIPMPGGYDGPSSLTPEFDVPDFKQVVALLELRLANIEGLIRDGMVSPLYVQNTSGNPNQSWRLDGGATS